jgi:FMN-dependent NADH-azoreductase
LLHVDSSILGANSVSRTLSAAVVDAERAKIPGLVVVYRDLAADPLQHITGAHLAAGQMEAVALPAPLQHDLAHGASDLEEFLAADIIVVGAPMYNFGIPSQLKAWIDRLAVKGKTFTYSETGPRGLAGGKTLIIASSRGGFYGETTPYAALDHQETYLRGVFQFFGITDIQFIRAEGVNIPDQRPKSIALAREEIAKLVA